MNFGILMRFRHNYSSLKLSCKLIFSQEIRSLSTECKLTGSTIILCVALVVVVGGLQGDQIYSLTLMFVVYCISCE